MSTGPINIAKQMMRNTIAGSSTFQNLVGETTQADALNHVYEEVIPEKTNDYTRAELEALRPFAIVKTIPEDSYVIRRAARGTQNLFFDSGRMSVEIERDAPGDGVGADLVSFQTIVGNILVEMTNLAGQADYLDINEFFLTDYMIAHPDHIATQGDYQLAVIRVTWGVRS